MLPIIGLSACYFHADPERPIFKGKTLMYMEQSMTQYCMRNHTIPFLLPEHSDEISVAQIVARIDGLLLQGGSDIAPTSYKEAGINENQWPGDPHRDQYEIALFKECLNQKKPILGICRGHQLINVALGGTLYQDIFTQKKDAILHRDFELYDQLFHEISIKPNSHLSKIYSLDQARVNSVHHQAIKDLGQKLEVEAWSSKDNLIEAVRYTGDSYVYGVQWHPEFHGLNDASVLDPDPLFADFLHAIRLRIQSD